LSFIINWNPHHIYMDKYILVISLAPLKTMLSDILYKLEIQKSEKIIKVTSSTIPQISITKTILNDNFKIEILDVNKRQDVISFNNLTIIGIEYDLILNEIIFVIDQHPMIIGHRFKIEREGYEIRTNICAGLKKISEISLTGRDL